MSGNSHADRNPFFERDHRGARQAIPIDDWQPILQGSLADEAFDTAQEIVEVLEQRAPDGRPSFRGDASAALLLAHCGSAHASIKLESALSSLREPSTVSLFGGVCGVLWTLQECCDDEQTSSIVGNFELTLLKHLDVPKWEGRFDLLNGLAGVGVYAAERRSGRAVEIGSHVVAHLAATAISAGEGTTWRTQPKFLHEGRRGRFPDGVIDLGVAHGVPGLIGALASLVEADIEATQSRRLLVSAIDWLLGAVPEAQPRFGSQWPMDGDESKRIGWCYGDMGVAGVLLRAARALLSRELQEQALGILRRSIGPLTTREIPDASFCHGIAGLAHIYNAAFQQTGDLDMREQAQYWLAELLRYKQPGTGIAGYTSVKLGGEAPRWVGDATLLSGVVGIALILLAAVADSRPAWQRLFLL